MQNKVIQYTFLLIFVLTAVLTLLAIADLLPHEIPQQYLWPLFSALLLQLIAVVIAAARTAFGESSVEHYIWQITYPPDLRENFEKLYLQDQTFADFYTKNRNADQSAIHDDTMTKTQLRNFLDNLFVIKKAGEFASNTADGQMFLIREKKDAQNFGTAVLTFPNESQPIAFTVTSAPALNQSWHLRFGQPDRYVEYEGRINKWRGGDLDVDFTQKGQDWSGELHFTGVYVGRFSLSRQ